MAISFWLKLEFSRLRGGSTGAFGQFVHSFGAFVGDGATGVTVTFIIADSGDSSLDSVAYISQLGGSVPPPPIPAPAGLLLMGSGLLLLARKRK